MQDMRGKRVKGGDIFDVCKGSGKRPHAKLYGKNLRKCYRIILHEARFLVSVVQH